MGVTGKGPEQYATDFLRAFAKAVLAWQHVEDSIYLIFNSILRHDEPKIVAAAFHAVLSLDARISMVDESLRAATNEEAIIKRWATLNKRVKRRALIRNKLAHLGVTDVVSREGFSMKLISSMHQVSSRGRVEHDIEEIKGFWRSFCELTNELIDFRAELDAHFQKASPRKSL
jgi:hypothetical protein